MSIRLFAALDLPDDVGLRLAALMRALPGASWRAQENLHLTLRFFDEVTEPVGDEIAAELAAIAERCAPFELKLKGAGVFGKADPHTLWVGAGESKELAKLAADCERAARRVGLKPEPRKFTPHVTLAYLSGSDPSSVQAFASGLGLFETRAFAVENFGLYSSWKRKSAPSLYRLEADYRLGA